jgi:hypothetical protein
MIKFNINHNKHVVIFKAYAKKILENLFEYRPRLQSFFACLTLADAKNMIPIFLNTQGTIYVVDCENHFISE